MGQGARLCAMRFRASHLTEHSPVGLAADWLQSVSEAPLPTTSHAATATALPMLNARGNPMQASLLEVGS
jgi:hypothetical protein